MTWKELGVIFVEGQWLLPNGEPFEQLTCRNTYYFLLYKRATTHRCIEKFINWNCPPPDWKRVWSNLTLWGHVRSIRDTNWQLFHSILPTKDRLLKFRMRVGPMCSCGNRETLIHLFTDCPFFHGVVMWVLSIFKPYNNSKNCFSKRELLFGFIDTPRTPRCFSALIGIARHYIWVARNAYTF